MSDIVTDIYEAINGAHRSVRQDHDLMRRAAKEIKRLQDAATEINKLATYFRHEARSDGFEGDVEGASPADSAIRVMRREASVGRWQPIKTAPKDGTLVLGWTPAGNDIVWFARLVPDHPQEPGHNPGWWGLGGETAPGRTIEHGFVGDPYWGPQNQPTHWMSLPQPPRYGTTPPHSAPDGGDLSHDFEGHDCGEDTCVCADPHTGGQDQ